MAFPQHAQLLFYPWNASEKSRDLSGCFRCGIYKAKPVDQEPQVKKSLLKSLFTRSSDEPLKSPEVEFMAVAQVQEVDNALVVLNIAALERHGPLMYACLLHLAREQGCVGLRPTLKTKDILDRPKEIWKKFATDSVYSGRVLLKSENQPNGHPSKQSRWMHKEDWLNKIYQLEAGANLVHIDHMRSNAREYWNRWEKHGKSEAYLDDFALKMLRLSVDAHNQE